MTLYGTLFFLNFMFLRLAIVLAIYLLFLSPVPTLL